MIGIAFIVCIAAIIALAIGLRGRRVDDHPVCRQCGFDVVGTLSQSATCPECGCGLKGRTRLLRRPRVRIGNRQRSGVLVVMAAVVMVISGGLGSFLAWDARTKGGWNAHKPVWWLTMDAGTQVQTTVDAALTELLAREGRGELKKEQVLALADRGLAWQADESRPWLKSWGDLIEIAWQKDWLSPEQRKAYAAHAVSLKLEARSKVRKGEQVPALVRVEPRIGSASMFDFDLKLSKMTLGEQQLLGAPFQANGDLSPTPMGGGQGIVMEFAPPMEFESPDGWPAPSGSDADAAVTAEPGQYTLKAAWHIGVTARGTGKPGMAGGYSWGRNAMSSFPLGRGRAGTPLGERDLELNVPVEVVPESTQTVELVQNGNLAEPVRQAVQIQIMDEKAMAYRPAGRRAMISMGNPPVDLAFDVTVRGAGKEKHSHLSVNVGQGGGFTEIDVPGRGDDATYDVILTPDPLRARRTVGMTRIWGKELVYEKLKVEKSPELSGFGAPASDPGTGVMASLTLPGKDRFAPENHAFRSVALRMPTVYVGDREGDVYIFHVDEQDRDETRDAVKVLSKVGDGNDLKVIGDVMLCTKNGSLAAYSLKNPEDPELIGTFGPPMRSRSDSLVIGGGMGYLLGSKSIVCFDLSDPAQPQLISTLELPQSPWAGCVADGRLYAAELGLGADETGIGVYDVSKPSDIKRVGFVKTPQGAHAVYSLPGGRILAMLDSASMSLSGPGPHGATLILDIKDPTHPKILSENPGTSGRVSALAVVGSERYLACPGAVMKLDGNSLTSVFPLYSRGSNLDGAAYHGDSDGQHAALALDDTAVVIRIAAPKGHPE